VCFASERNIRTIFYRIFFIRYSRKGKARVHAHKDSKKFWSLYIEAYIFLLICSFVEMYDLHTACKSIHLVYDFYHKLFNNCIYFSVIFESNINPWIIALYLQYLFITLSFRLTMDDDNSWVYYRKCLIFLKESICILKNNLIK